MIKIFDLIGSLRVKVNLSYNQKLRSFSDKFQRCFVCDSETDQECLNLSATTNIPQQICADYTDSCATYVIRKLIL